MNNGLEGIPGSGKSYEAVVFHVLDALKRGRRVVTNLPLNIGAFVAVDPAYADLLEIRATPQPAFGVWDALAAGTTRPLFKLFRDMPEDEWPSGVVMLTTDSADGPVKLPGLPARPDLSVFSTVWDFFTLWKGKDGNGPLFVVDECHVPLPKIGTQLELVHWFKQHRHFNVDVLLMTPNFRDVCGSITGLMGVVVKVRKADILGRKDSYIRKVHAGYRGAVISQEERDYKPQFFPLYQSHTQGNSVAENSASDVAPFSVKFARFTKFFWVVALAGVAWAFWPTGDSKAETAKKAAIAKAVATKPTVTDEDFKRMQAWRPAPGTIPSEVPAPAASAASAAKPEPENAEPFAGKKLHITGRIRSATRDLLTLSVSMAGQRVFDVTGDDLRQAGYGLKVVGDCIAVVTWEAKPHTITCDAPTLAEGSRDRPVVVTQPVSVASITKTP